MLTGECNQVYESWEMLIMCSAMQLKKARLKCRAGNDQAGERAQNKDKERKKELTAGSV